MTKTKQPDRRVVLPCWDFSIKNLGAIKTGEFEYKPLTIFCGPNSSGKTWALNCLYSFLDQPMVFPELPGLSQLIAEAAEGGAKSWDIVDWMERNVTNIIEGLHVAMARRMPGIFNIPEESIEGASFNWLVSPKTLIERTSTGGFHLQQKFSSAAEDSLIFKKESGERTLEIYVPKSRAPIAEIILTNLIVNFLVGIRGRDGVFLMPAERLGLHLFSKELNNNRAELVQHARGDSKELKQLMEKYSVSKYSVPVAHYIDWLSDLPEMRKEKSDGYEDLADEVAKIISGSFDISQDNEIFFAPSNLSKIRSKQRKIEFHVSSSSAKSLFGLWFFLKHQAKHGSALMIDEPEINLHPGNQRALARLLARVANRGIRVLISTHSDYIVREINSLIMLSKSHKDRDKLMKKFSYRSSEILKTEMIGAYLFNDGKISSMKITQSEGIEAETFDSIINSLNNTSDEIYYTLSESEDNEN